MKIIRMIALTVLLPACPAGAWGPLGHKAVARVAQHRLSAGARAAVERLLGPGGDLAAIANCADNVLYTTAPVNCGGYFMMAPDPAKKTGPWHYIDIPSTAAVTAATLLSFCPGGTDCVVAQINLQEAVLADPGAGDDQKRLALAYLVHFVGDAHMPLHASNDDDMGGNKKALVFDNAAKNLHSLWDDLIRADDWRAQSKEDPAALTARLEAKFSAADVDRWTTGDFVAETALEGHAIASAIRGEYADSGKNLDRVYERCWNPVASIRLEMAGARLAALLEKALGGPSAPIASRMSIAIDRAARIGLLVPIGSSQKFD